MGTRHCKDHRTGIVYVYETEKATDPMTGKTSVRKKMVGRLDDDGNVVPTSGRRGRLPKKAAISGDAELSRDALVGRIEALSRRNAELEEKVRLLEQDKQFLINGIGELLSHVR